jgi:peptidyl-prolyl cis-trans isomerase C
LLAGLCGVVSAQLAVPPGRPAPKPAAVVNGQEISAAQLEAALKVRGPMPLHLPDAERRQRQIEALSALIDELLLHQFLDQQKVPAAPPAEVERCVKEMEQALLKQNKSLAEYCQDTNQTLAQFKAGIAEGLRWNAYAAPFATDAAVEKYFQENHDFFEGTQVRASHIVLRIPASAPDAERAAERAKARQKLNELRAQIVSGRLDFAEAARLYSQDPRRSAGGDLGFIGRKGPLDDAFNRAAFALAPGQVSEVVDTDYGAHLIKVVERKPGQPFDYAKNKERVRALFMEDLCEQVLGRHRKAAKIEINLP